MKSKSYKEFFENFKNQSTCLVCGKPLYIKQISKYDNQHLSKTCYKHTYHALTNSIEIKKDIIIFNRDGLLVMVNNIYFNKIDMTNLVILYDEKSFMSFIQNLKVLL